jgi:dolichol-phosphate mannosyltransferase
MPVLVVIPTYDERENIELTVARVRASVADAHVLIVDDDSPDGTGSIADGLAATDGHVHVIHRSAKNGLGAAYLAAFAWALPKGYDPIVQLDADGSHRPEELPRMLARLDGGVDGGEDAVDLVVGSRWVPGGRIVNWPRRRQLLSRAGSAYAHVLLRLPVRDATGGYRVFRADALRHLRLDDVHTRGYGFQVDMIWHARMAGLRIAEVPITFVEREHGRSKMSPGIVLEAMVKVTGWGIRTLLHRDQPAALSRVE